MKPADLLCWKAMSLRAVVVVWALLVGTSQVAAGLDEEFLGPFSSWRDLRRDYGAIADGHADDTALHGWASKLPRLRSITNPCCHRSLPIELFQPQSDSQTPSESFPKGGTSAANHCA